MINEEKGLQSGVFTYNYEQRQLELFDMPLRRGCLMEVWIFQYWLPGHLQRDASGWYLLTFDYVEVRLRSGLCARYLEPFLSFHKK